MLRYQTKPAPFVQRGRICTQQATDSGYIARPSRAANARGEPGVGISAQEPIKTRGNLIAPMNHEGAPRDIELRHAGGAPGAWFKTRILKTWISI